MSTSGMDQRVTRPANGLKSRLRSVRIGTELAVHRAKLAGMVVYERSANRSLGSLSAVATTAPFFAMTYDDGPTPQRTPGILRALRETGSHATFFVLMHNARLNTGLLREVVAEGHEIALHGMDHRRLSSVPPQEHTRLLVEAKERLEDLTGAPTRWYRPPYGVQTRDSWAATEASGLSTAIWSRTSWDWKDTHQDHRLSVATMDAKPGVIILLHDGHAGPPDRVESAPEPVMDRYDLTSRIARAYAEVGLRSCTLTELTSYGSPILRPSFQPRLSMLRPTSSLMRSRSSER